MSKPEYLYTCFVNIEECGEVHLRRSKITDRRGDDFYVGLVYNGDYDEKEVTYERVSEKCVEQGNFDHDEGRFFSRWHERPTTDEHWNRLDATPGFTREQAILHQKRRLQGRIRAAREKIEQCESIIETLDAGTSLRVYDEKWNTVEHAPLEQLAAEAE